MSRFSYPLLNGVAASWADIALRLKPNGGSLLEVGDIAAVSGTPTVEVGEQREGGRVIATTRGSVSNEASITLYASGYQKILRGFLPVAPIDPIGGDAILTLVHFDFTLHWTPPGAIDILERRFQGCRFLSLGNDNAEGNDATQFVCPLHVTKIVDVVDGRKITLG